MNVNQERIKMLQQEMKAAGMDMYLVPTADFHQSEYVGTYFKVRAWLSGFSGSAGTLLVTADGSYLWTDGRYFIQAAKQLEGTGVALMKMGEEGVPTVEEFLEEHLPENGCLGCDGRTIHVAEGKEFEALLAKKNGTLKCGEDLGGKIWTDRPQMSKEPVYLLDVKYAGQRREEKIAAVREEMKKEGTNTHIICSMDDIVWLLNIRGNDIVYNPVVLSYVMITMDKVYFYVQEEAVSGEVRAELEKAGVELHPYFEIYDAVKTLKDSDKVLVEDICTNYTLYKSIPEHTEVVFAPNPAAVMKGNKNQTEMENIRIAHIKDAKAMCRFIYWLKQNVGSGEVTEYSAAEKSLELRKEDPDCLDLSFETICAYGPNAAMCHYAPTETEFAKVEPKGFFLIDSGGQYWQGTTDITRTIAVGELTQQQKEHFTLVLQGHIRLAMAKFQYGCSGANLDALVRGPLWERGLDFNHGTGHGVGYLLNVHEGPQNINWRVRANGRRGNTTPLEEGMLTSNEPGLYLEGKYGIRTENLLLCKKAEKNGYGQFMEFENVTWVPYEREAILPEMLTKAERQWLNAYHKKVYEIVGPMLEEEERTWLLEATAEI